VSREEQSHNRSERWYRIQNAADGTDAPAEVFIYDTIGSWYGVSASDFVRDIAGVDNDAITVRINSPGGDVFDGIAIMNALRGHKATITTVVDGLAASAASFIAMAGDEVVMNRNSEMMIHDASGFASGKAKDMIAMADNLERASNNIASIYADKAGGTAEDWRAAMTAETWYTAQEAVDAGLADRVTAKADDAESESDGAKASFDLSIFNYAGRQAAPAPTAVTQTPSAERAGVSPNRKDDIDMSTLNEGLRKALGIDDADLSDEALLDKINDALKERDEALEAATSPANAAPKLPEGVVAIDATTLDELKNAAKLGTQAREQQIVDHRNSVLDAAVRAGKFPPARREHFENLHKADPEGAEQLIASLAAGTVPVNSELGHAGEPEVNAELDAELSDVFARITGSAFGKDA
jgi:ATP-dependent Clp endopeptidase proteolytic subunit ClpP